MIEEASDSVKSWARGVVDARGMPTNHSQFRALIEHERHLSDYVRSGMTQLPVITYATAIVHHNSPHPSADKVREIEILVSSNLSRRNFWDHVERANYYMAGLQWARR